MTRAGVGFSDALDSREAAAAAARTALDRAGGSCSLALLFTTSRHDPESVRDGVRQVVGPECRLLGGYGVGIITNEHLSYDGYEVGVLALSIEARRIHMFLEEGLAQGVFEAGAALGRRIVESGVDLENLLLFYDSINRTEAGGRLVMNMATPLLAGLSGSVRKWPHAAGAGLVGDMQCRPTYQWFDQRVVQQSVLALVLSDLRLDSVIMHGCRPASSYHTITRSEGPVVLEIDGTPATDWVARLLGEDSGISWRDYSFFVTLGVNTGDPYAEFDEDRYANRLCMGVDVERKGLVMFEPDLTPGTRVQLMRRSVDFAYVGRKTAELLSRLESRRPIFALYIDCAGRAAEYSGLDAEEARDVQQALGDIPLLGFYSGVELARMEHGLQPLDWTGVLCVFSEEL